MIKKLYFKFSKYFGDLKLKHKLLLLSFILIIVPIAFCTVISYKIVSDNLKSKTIIYAKQVLDEVSYILDRKILNVINTMDIVSLDANLNEVLTRNKEDYSIPRQIDDNTKLTSFFNRLEKNNDIHRIKLYVRDGLIYSEENVNFFNIESIRGLQWYRSLKQSKSTIVWYPPSYEDNIPGKQKTRVVSAVRRVWNLNNYGEELAVLRLEIMEKSIEDIIKKSNVTKTGIAFIQNSKQKLISCSSREVNDNWSSYKEIISKVNGGNWVTIEFRGQKSIIACKGIDNTDWTFVSIIPLKEVLDSSAKITNQMLALTLVVIVLIYMLVYYIASQYTKNIKQLVEKMKRVQDGDLDVIISSYGKDEVGELVANFNYMINKMTLLIEEQYMAGQQLKNAELRALQAQINPHFLYNSLDAVNCMAIKNNVPEIRTMVDLLARFYKLSLNKGSDMISIRDEVEHVKVYVRIQNIRFNGLIKLETEIDESIYEYRTIKLILQPLVENSIIHGIFQKNDKKGIIKVTGILSGQLVVLSVQDDGVGMTGEKIESMFTKTDTEQVHSYGVKNVNERIKLCFGLKYGLSYKSVLGKGTAAEITIPAIK